MALYYIEQLRQLVNSDKWPYNICDWTPELNEATNCLAFALGLPYFDESKTIFIPSSSMSIEKFCCNFLSYIDLDCKKISSFEEALENELVVKGFEFISPLTNKKSFHFIRRNPNGKWYHKMGWHEAPTEVNWNTFNLFYPDNLITFSFTIAVKKRTSN